LTSAFSIHDFESIEEIKEILKKLIKEKEGASQDKNKK
jgi:hypothetical protein